MHWGVSNGTKSLARYAWFERPQCDKQNKQTYLLLSFINRLSNNLHPFPIQLNNWKAYVLAFIGWFEMKKMSFDNLNQWKFNSLES